MSNPFEQPCGCSDCRAAVSPGAYLAALLDFGLNRIRRNKTNKIDLPFLVENFHQPFIDLPADCKAIEKTVRQARLCVEVLRRYIGKRPLADAGKEAALTKAEEDHRVAAYTLLLSRIGTSSQEVRRIRTAPQAARRALADRLGIDLTDPAASGGDELEQLLLDVAAISPASNRLSEEALEARFGLTDTTRDPLSDGIKSGDDKAQLTRWNFDGVAWGRNTDENGMIHVTVASPAAGVFRVEVYNDAARAKGLVAAGEIATASGIVRLLPENGSRLSGTVQLAYTADSKTIAIAALPRVSSWQLRHLRTVWRDADHPADAYRDPDSPPVIDPDLIGPDDFRMPFAKPTPAAADRPFDLWLQRRKFIADTLSKIDADRKLNGLAATLQQVLADPSTPMTPIPDLDELLRGLTAGPAREDVQASTARVTALGLSVESFTYLMAIRAKNLLAASDDRNAKVTDEEWREVASILTQVAKTRAAKAWRAAEKTAGIVFGAGEFWKSIREPKEGDWPPAAAPDEPLIDPSILTRADLPEWLVGKEAEETWKTRKAAVDKIPADLKQERESQEKAAPGTGFDAMLRLALGHPLPGNPLQHDLDALDTELGSTDADKRAAATRTIETHLYMPVEKFKRLMALAAADRQSTPAKKPTSTQWTELYGLLAGPRKIKHLHPKWVGEELASGLVYWKALKARLPRWRATSEARRAWQQALHLRSRRPIVDPTLMGADDIRQKRPGDPAFDLWKARSDHCAVVRADLVQIRETAGTALAGLDAIIEKALGVQASVLEAIDAEREAGHDIDARLEQLGLLDGGFPYLMQTRALATVAAQVTASEWTTTYDTLTHARIQREYAVFREEEYAFAKSVLPLTLSSDYFTIPTALTAPLPFIDATAPVWLSTWAARRDWQEQLQSRMDQERSTLDALGSAVGAVEEVALPVLRNALIDAAEAQGSGVDERATWLTGRLLLDNAASGCHMTTRVEQAIETIQSLIFTLRTGQFAHLASLPLSLILDDFEEQWKWMGSYATWRPPVFIKLYPENLAQPSLRKRQTEGFATLLANTRGRRVDPRLAEEAAEEYASHYRDITTLQIEATCQAGSKLFMFGRALRSGRVYWSTYDLAASSAGYAQTFWKEFKGFAPAKVARIIGAMPYRQKHGEDQSPYVFLFCKTSADGVDTLQVAKLGVDRPGTWDATTVHPLDVPPYSEGAASVYYGFLEVVPVQTRSESGRPALVFHFVDSGSLYYRQLNADGDAWDPTTAGWPASTRSVGSLVFGRIEAALRVKGQLWIVEKVSTGFSVGVTTLGAGLTFTGYTAPPWALDDRTLEYLGVTPATDGLPTSAIYLFSRRADGNYYQQFTAADPDPPRLQHSLAGLVRISAHSGAGSSGTQMLVYTRSMSGPSPSYYAYKYAEVNDGLVGSGTFRVRPDNRDTTAIVASVSAAQNQVRRQAILDAFVLNIGASPAVLSYLHEFYCFVPIHLALQLQSAGHYAQALDRFRTVYDYEARLGSPNERNIYYGLELDANLPDVPSYYLASDWLLDPLDPHAIAATRRNAYTRFTLMALVRCLLDYADAEFTIDTGESLARARTLYLTAMDLLDLPVLEQKLGLCDKLVAQLTIAPGTDVPPEVPAIVAGLVEELTSYELSGNFLGKAVKDLQAAFDTGGSWTVKLSTAKQIVDGARAGASLPQSTGELVSARSEGLKDKHALLLKDAALDVALQNVSRTLSIAMD